MSVIRHYSTDRRCMGRVATGSTTADAVRARGVVGWTGDSPSRRRPSRQEPCANVACRPSDTSQWDSPHLPGLQQPLVDQHDTTVPGAPGSATIPPPGPEFGPPPSPDRAADAAALRRLLTATADPATGRTVRAMPNAAPRAPARIRYWNQKKKTWRWRPTTRTHPGRTDHLRHRAGSAGARTSGRQRGGPATRHLGADRLLAGLLALVGDSTLRI
jgi:hypothetical protein